MSRYVGVREHMAGLHSTQSLGEAGARVLCWSLGMLRNIPSLFASGHVAALHFPPGLRMWPVKVSRGDVCYFQVEDLKADACFFATSCFLLATCNVLEGGCFVRLRCSGMRPVVMEAEPPADLQRTWG